jgi:putative thiamine transport system permease protein
MAAPLRYPLILLAWGRWRLIYLPLLPAATDGRCALPAHWQALFADLDWARRWRRPRLHAVIRRRRAADRLTIVAALWPSARWRRLASRLPLLAVPHLALATAALLLFAEGAGSGSGCRFDAAG